MEGVARASKEEGTSGHQSSITISGTKGSEEKGAMPLLQTCSGRPSLARGHKPKLMHLKAKLDAKRYGPFPITKEISLVVYQLALPPQWCIHNVFYASLLTPYKEMEEHGDNFAQSPPELIEGQEEYKVEQVMDLRHMGHTKKLQYLLW
jgi:hypothetical protein